MTESQPQTPIFSETPPGRKPKTAFLYSDEFGSRLSFDLNSDPKNDLIIKRARTPLDKIGIPLLRIKIPSEFIENLPPKKEGKPTKKILNIEILPGARIDFAAEGLFFLARRTSLTIKTRFGDDKSGVDLIIDPKDPKIKSPQDIVRYFEEQIKK